MKKITYALLATVATVAVATPVFAQDTVEIAQGPYVSVSAGASQPRDSSVLYRDPVGSPAIAGKTEFDTGFALTGAVGYRWARGLRTEAEVNYRQSEFDDIANAATTGRQKVLGLMGNILFDIDLGENSRFRPYIGGGAGVGYTKWKHVQTGASTPFPVGGPLFNDRDTAFQWQAIGGFNHAINENVDAFIEYRYIGLENLKFRTTTPAGLSTASEHNDRSHNLLLGVRFNFG